MPPQDGLKFLFDIQDKISAKLAKIEAKSKSSAARIDKAFTRSSKSQESNSIKLAAIEQRRVAAADSNATKLAAIAQRGALAEQRRADKIAAALKRETAARQKAADSAGKISKTFRTFSQATFAGVASGAAAVALARKAWTSFTGVISSSLSLWGQQEQAVVAMTTALKAQGLYTPALAQQYQDMASGLQGLSTDGDEALIKMQALLIQVGDVGPDKMREALTAAQDLATGLDVDLKTAALLVGKAFAGDTATLKRYGIVLDQTELKQQGVSVVLDAIQKKFGGQAAAKAETFAGIIEQLGNNWGDLKEKIGEWLTQAGGSLGPTLSKVNKAVAWMNENFESLKPFIAGVATAIGVTLVTALAALGVVIWTTIVPAVTAMTGGVKSDHSDHCGGRCCRRRRLGRVGR